MGYLIPFDGTAKKEELYKNISMTMIRDDISKRIPAKHIFYIVDACYSGILVVKRGMNKESSRDYNYLKEIANERVRQVLTAGDKDQQVLDGGPKGHSVFTGRLIEMLENSSDFITATEISTAVKEKVFSDANARNHLQTPKYGELYGLGDYIFIPSMESKTHDNQAEVVNLQKELERLKALEESALNANNESAKRQAEIDKRVIESKLKAEQLKQQTLEEDRTKRENDEKEQLKEKSEIELKKKEEETRLAMLKKEVEEKRKMLDKVSFESISPEYTINKMRELDIKINEIKSDFKKELENGISQIENRFNDKMKKNESMQKDEFETENEFESKIKKQKDDAQKNRDQEINELTKKIETESNNQVAPLTKNLRKLSKNEFTLTSKDLILEIHEYNPEKMIYPVTIEIKDFQKYNFNKNFKGILDGTITISKDVAKELRQHFNNNMIRTEIKFGFLAGYNLITKAYIIDEATNIKYGLYINNDFENMVFIEGGCFDMGDTFGDGEDNEKPVHEVCVDDFYMSKYEVTQFEWKEIMGNNPLIFKDCDNCPVETVSWNDVEEYIKKLNKKTGMNYRLPTEAEWEYAARSGGKKEKWAGTSNEGELEDYSWYISNSGSKTHPVGQNKPNGLGLYDMSGNVWEWCSDWYAENYDKNNLKDNPIGAPEGSSRVIRGGGWDLIAGYCRSAIRYYDWPSRRYYNLGFRLALPAGQ